MVGAGDVGDFGGAGVVSEKYFFGGDTVAGAKQSGARGGAVGGGVDCV